MTSLEAAALWVGLNALLLIFLSVRVGRARMKHKIFYGDDGNAEMAKAVRTQGNYIEYAPAALVGLVTLALLGADVVLIHILGAVFFLARVAHLLGFGMDAWKQGRVIGASFTMITLFATAITLFILALT